MATNNQKYSNFGIIINAPKEKTTDQEISDFYASVISTIQDYNKVKFFASAIHDKDHHEDGTPKRPHLHIMCETYEKSTHLGALRDFAKALGLDKDLISLEGSNNLALLVQYLTHKGKPNKHQYDYSIIKTSNAEYCEELYNLEYVDPEKELLDKIKSCRTTTELAETLGPTNATKFLRLFDRLQEDKKTNTADILRIHEHLREKYGQLLDFANDFFVALLKIETLGAPVKSIVKNWADRFNRDFWNEF